jgi:hypothetical protein
MKKRIAKLLRKTAERIDPQLPVPTWPVWTSGTNAVNTTTTFHYRNGIGPGW